MAKKKANEEIERAVDEQTSQRLHLDWWAFIVAGAIALVLLIWQWSGGSPSIPFKEVVKGLIP
jgi:hypothetical protein